MESYITQSNFFEGNEPEKIAQTYGTPLYVYNERILRERMHEVACVITKYPYTANYSVKANTNIHILKLALEEGWSYQLISDAILMGDVNGDDDIDINDVTCIQLHLAYIRTLSSEGVLAADVDGDGVISINDATKIQKYLVGIIKSL